MEQFQLIKKNTAAAAKQGFDASGQVGYQDSAFMSWKKQIARQLTVDMGCTQVAGDYLSNTQFAMVAWRSGLSVGEAADFLYEANRDLCDSLATNERLAFLRSSHLNKHLLQMLFGDDGLHQDP